MGHVVGADGEAVDVLQELVGEHGVGGQFAHHHDLQAVFAPFQAQFGHPIQDPALFLHRAHEGDHQHQVGQAHVVAHPAHGFAFQGEGVGEGARGIAGRAAEAQHGVLFLGLELGAADQRRVFVGFEVGQTGDHWVGVKGRRDGGHALGEGVDVEIGGGDMAGDAFADDGLQIAVQTVQLQQGARVDADVGVDDEFEARETDAAVGQFAGFEGDGRIRQVQHDLGVRPRNGGHVHGFGAERQVAGVDVAGVAFGAGDGDLGAVAERLGAVSGADDGGNAQFTGDDGGVAGASAAVGDDGGGDFHHRFPVRVGHVGDQHVAGLDHGHLICAGHQPHRAVGHAGSHGLALAQHLTAPLQLEGFLHGAVGLYGLGPGLDDEQIAGNAVQGPFDVHGAWLAGLGGIVFLNGDGVVGQG